MFTIVVVHLQGGMSYWRVEKNGKPFLNRHHNYKSARAAEKAATSFAEKLEGAQVKIIDLRN